MTTEQTFSKEVIKEGKVWTLASDKGWAVSESVEYEDAEAFPFWSAEAKAAHAATETWHGYKPEPIPLPVFLEEWLPGMHFDVTLAGVNWGADRTGQEMEPLKLAQEIIEALKLEGVALKFQHYNTLAEYEQEVKHALQG